LLDRRGGRGFQDATDANHDTVGQAQDTLACFRLPQFRTFLQRQYAGKTHKQLRERGVIGPRRQIERFETVSELLICHQGLLGFVCSKRWLALQIAGVYHHSVHSALHCPPIEAWRNGLSDRLHEPRLPADHEQFFRDFLPGELRLVRRDGIRLFNIHYWDNILSSLSGRSKRKFLIKYDPRDLSRIYFQEENGTYWPIPYRDLRLPPISLWEQREAMRAIRAKGQKDVNENLIFDCIAKQRLILARARKTVRQRREAERFKRRSQPVLESNCPEDAVADQDYSHLLPFKVEQW
jgi:Mu transposase, C-terminal